MSRARRIDVSLAGSPPLRDDVAHVWLAPLDVPAATVERLWALLSPAERARAARFHAETHRRRFVVRRARLRELLAPYVGCAPRAVELEEPPGRKPRLAGRAEIAFSVSHSGELAAFAVGTRAVGVDIERIEPSVDLEAVTRSFAERERAAISGAPEAGRLRRFFECWTCKEAYVKARGNGLATPLDTFDVSDALVRERLARVHADGAGGAFAVRLVHGPSRHALALAWRVSGDN